MAAQLQVGTIHSTQKALREPRACFLSIVSLSLPVSASLLSCAQLSLLMTPVGGEADLTVPPCLRFLLTRG